MIEQRGIDLLCELKRLNNNKNHYRTFNFMCEVLIDARGGHARYLLNLACDFKHNYHIAVAFSWESVLQVRISILE